MRQNRPYGLMRALQQVSTATNNAGPTRWACECGSLGQATSGRRCWADGTPVAGQQYGYGFEDMGNREWAAAGGDGAGGARRRSACQVNGLNQYTRRSVPGVTEVVGVTAANRLVRLTQHTATNAVLVSEFTYDGLGRRARARDRIGCSPAATEQNGSKSPRSGPLKGMQAITEISAA